MNGERQDMPRGRVLSRICDVYNYLHTRVGINKARTMSAPGLPSAERFAISAFEKKVHIHAITEYACLDLDNRYEKFLQRSAQHAGVLQSTAIPSFVAQNIWSSEQKRHADL